MISLFLEFIVDQRSTMKVGPYEAASIPRVGDHFQYRTPDVNVTGIVRSVTWRLIDGTSSVVVLVSD